jgi:hypothetical protein
LKKAGMAPRMASRLSARGAAEVAVETTAIGSPNKRVSDVKGAIRKHIRQRHARD